jgi:hypothetical protein
MTLFSRVWYYLMFPFLCISYLLTPLTHDAQTFIGAERIADLFYPFPQGIDLAWEIKPIGNRIANWVLYKWGDTLVGFASPWFPLAVKLLALLAVLAVSYYFAAVVPGWYVFPLAFTALTAVSDINILQAEYWAVLLALVCIAMLLDSYWYCPVVGALFVGIVLLKGITGLMLVSILCAVFLLGNVKLSERFGGLYLGVMAGIGAFSVLSLTVWVHMIPDMLMAAQLAHVGFFSWWYILASFIIWTAYFLPSTPIAFFAAFVALFVILYLDLKRAAVFALAWAAPLVMVLIQGEFMIYHYFPCTVPAVVTLILWERGK